MGSENDDPRELNNKQYLLYDELCSLSVYGDKSASVRSLIQSSLTLLRYLFRFNGLMKKHHVSSLN
jgi:hypothetical protein